MIKIFPLVKPNFNVVEKYLKDNFESFRLANFGPSYERLADELAVFFNLPSDKKVVLTSSGTTALMAAYNQCTLHDDKSFFDSRTSCGNLSSNYKSIYCPSYTFPATWLAIPSSLESKFYKDIEDLNSLLLFDNILSVVAPLSTLPNLKFIENKFGLMCPIVIDGAATFGTKEVYWYGDYYCLSFHATKTFPLGEGGAIICPAHEEESIKNFLNFGMSRNKTIWKGGINGKISESTCAIGLSILSRMDEIVDKRLRNAAIYKKRLDGLIEKSWIEDTVYQVFPIFLPTVEKAEKVRECLTANDIQNLQYYKPQLQAFTKYAQDKYDRNVCLPVHQDLEPKDINLICDLVLSV